MSADAPTSGQRRILTGWGRTTRSGADVVAPVLPTDVTETLATAGARGVLARGLGRSYGDAAQNAGGTVLDATALDGIHAFDAGAGTVTVDAGISLDTLLRRFVPRGWFVPVVPGTRHVTVGGAIAADVHGKNHHRDGTFTSHVRELTLETPTGTIVASPHDDADVFWATAGGMGLTGVVTSATIGLLPIRTSRVRVDTDRCANLDEAMALMDAEDRNYTYSVAWLDCLSRGRSLGRAVLTRGEHAAEDDLAPLARREPLRFDPAPLASAPPWVPSGMVNGTSIRAFNEAWFRRAPQRARGEIQPLDAFFFPLDTVRRWNRLYGPRGFLQYQFVVPFEAAHVVRQVVEVLSRRRIPAFLAVLKRFGAANPGPLSFPLAGWTLALDLPAKPQLRALLDRFDAVVADAGGRVYLAKDARMRPELLPRMYPRLGEWCAIRDRIVPGHELRSDLARRLGLVDAPRTTGNTDA